ncbi:MAG TPA: Gfo/Idh/MocA family oxidoreductase [Candidatus Acidoferrum sp.]|nr:Gfo/Idh/MocA family oxidoreductase [Candidatus Acidoferrum sp.]
MIEAGLIGFGLAGRAFHAPVIHAVPGLRLAAILQRSGNEAAQLYPGTRIVRSVEELLAISEIQLVVIATPNDTHHPIAGQCLAAGRDVVVDKPLSTTLGEALDLVKFAQERGRLLTVYHNRRYDGDFQAVQQLVASGRLGRLVRFESNYDRFRPRLKGNAWRERSGPGTGVFFDLAPHLIDHAWLLFGVPEAVTADIRMERENAVADDSFDLTLHYPRGLRAVLRATMLAAVTRPRFVLHGTGGAYVKHAFDVQEPKLRAGRIPWNETPSKSEQEENSGTLTLVNADGATTEQRIPPAQSDYRSYYANIRDVLLGTAAPAVTPQYALNVMRVLELAQESSARRCTIPWPG